MLARRLGLALLLSGCGVPVLVEYDATVATVSEGAPFGLTGADLGIEVTGSFGWLTDTPDRDPDPDRGEYFHAGDAPFEASFKDVTIEGRGNAIVGIENTDPDTFAFSDGYEGAYPQDGMLVDGEEDEDVAVTLRMTHATGAFGDDYLPESFDTNAASWTTTFVLRQRGGSVNLEITALR